MRHPTINPYMPIIIAVLAISTTSIFVKLAGGAPTGIIAFYRVLFALLVMAPIIFFKHLNELKKINLKNWLFIILSGLCLALHLILWFEALHYTSVTNTVVLISLSPIFVFIGAYLIFGERFSIAAFISVIITLIGGVVILLGDVGLSNGRLLGDVLAFLSAIVISVSLLIGQKARRKLALLTYTFLTLTSSVVFLLLYNIIVSNQFTGYALDIWGYLILLALIPTFLGQSIFNWALKWVNAAHISMALVFEPISAAILAYLILGEKIMHFQWIGGGVIIFGLFLSIVSTTKRRGYTISQK